MAIDNIARALALQAKTLAGLGGSSSYPGQAINVKAAPYNATGDGTTDDTAAIQAAINATDVNRGGEVFLPQGRYVASGLVANNQGTVLVGQGMPGAANGNGTTRIIVPNGATGITFNAASSGSVHGILGYGLRNLQFVAAAGATTGNGAIVQNTENFRAENVNFAGFIGGVGLTLDGKAGNAQYAQLVNLCGGDNLKTLRLMGTGPNGCRMFGGYMQGQGTTPRAGSIGVSVETGDTFRMYGTCIQGYETGIDIASAAAGHELYGPRLEFCNRGLHIGGSVQKLSMFGGSIVNTLLAGGGANIGILIDSGATAIFLMPNQIAGTSSNITDNSGGGVTVQGNFGGALGLTSYSNFITADVTIVNAATYYDGPSIALPAGTYLLTGALQFLAGSSAIRTWDAKIWDGTTAYDYGVNTVTGTGAAGQATVPVSALVTLASPTTLKISGSSTVGTSLDKIRGLSTKGSYLIAVKIA